VGQIVSVGLAHDAATVDARVYIQPDYRNLVRDNTQFWSNSGLHLKFGFSGLELGSDTLSNLALGGVTFATPTNPGEPVTTGKRFAIADQPDGKWLAWEPRIAVGTGFLREGQSFPAPERVTLRWSESFLGINRTKRRQGWVLALDEGRYLLGPADLLSPPPDASGDTILEVSGRELPITSDKSQVMQDLALYPVDGEPLSPESAWSNERLRTPTELESTMLIADPQTARLPLPTERLSKSEGSDDWQVDASVPLDASWHGGCLISVKDGRLIGIVLTNRTPAQIATGPRNLNVSK
jgi:hypothetical protein